MLLQIDYYGTMVSRIFDSLDTKKFNITEIASISNRNLLVYFFMRIL